VLCAGLYSDKVPSSISQASILLFLLDIFRFLVFMPDFKVAAFLTSRVKVVQDRAIVTVEHYQ